MKTPQLLLTALVAITCISAIPQSSAQTTSPPKPPVTAPSQSATSTDSKPELIFQTGFEGTSEVKPFSKSASAMMTPGFDVDVMGGNDTSLTEKSDWDKELGKDSANGRMFLEYTGGLPSQRFAKVIAEPGNPSNKVLQFWLADSWHASEGQEKARVQASLYGIHPGYKEFYHSVRVFLHEDFRTLENYPKAYSWFTVGEYWNNEWWDANAKNGFRISLGIVKPSEGKGPLRFQLNSEDQGFKSVWKAPTPDVTVPIGKWFTMETYFKEGDKNTGRFYVAITPDGGKREVIFDVHNFTHNTHDTAPDGMTGFNPMKLYTSKEVVGFMKSQGKALQIYWDDFKLWKNKRPE